MAFSDIPVFLAGRERLYEGLRKAGLPGGQENNLIGIIAAFASHRLLRSAVARNAGFWRDASLCAWTKSA
jgi:hypothetical protein